MEYGQQGIIFENNFLPSSRLLPSADGPINNNNNNNGNNKNVPKELFTLETVIIQEGFTPPVAPSEDGPVMEEPIIGLEPDWFDKHNYELTRLSKKHPARVPHLLKRNVQALRPPEAIKSNEKLVGLDAILNAVNPSSITYICLADVILPKKRLKTLHKSLAPFVNVEVLLLRGLRISSLSGCKFPNLRFLDLSHNNISRVANVVSLVKHSPNLDVVNVSYNPCAYKEDVVGRILAVCPFLGIVNEKELSVAERIHALELHGPRSMREELPWLRWDMALDLIPEISQMRFSHKGWDPQLIVAISLPNCGLTNIAVATMVNLQTLDVSNNQIADLRNTGIEQCNELSRINLKHNQIANISKCVPTLAQVKALLTVYLEGNEVVLKKNFRSKLIFQTRNLRGTNRSPGLFEIEGAQITIEERVAANELWANQQDPHDNSHAYRWFMSMCAKYGHTQMKTQLHKMISCTFPSKNLMFASLTGFFSLQHLDLSGNNLSDIGSLEQLELLRIVDLSENAKLSTTKVLKQLGQCTRLESFNFFVTNPPDHKRAPSNKSYRQSVLRSILFPNRSLTIVDNIPVKKEERIDTYADVGGTQEEVEKYRFNLALTLNCCSSVTSGGTDVRLHYAEVGIGEQYDPTAITGLRKLSNWGLTSRVCDFSRFVNLVELNISHNNLTEFIGMGLESHPHLRVLCATHNNISTPLVQIAAFLDSIAQLEIVCLRENPIMKSADDRMKLLGLLTRQREFAPVLHTLDSTITLNERIDAWKKMEADGGGQAPEQLRFSVVRHYFFAHQTQPVLPHELTTLNLSHAELAFVDVSEFVNLRELCLLGNRLENLENTGIIQLKNLEVLDLRFNLLPRLESIAAVASQLPLLETLGIAGNKCAPVSNMLSTIKDTLRDTRSYRVRFLSLLPDALRVRGHSLNVLDSKEITIEERAQAFKPESSSELLSSSLPNLPEPTEKKTHGTLSGVVRMSLRKGSIGSSSQSSIVDHKLMCWPMALLRRLPPTIPYSAITEADFSNCFLTVIDLSVLPCLTKLSLANNSMREQNLDRSNIHSLQDLRALDLRHNQLKSLTMVCEVITRIPRLEQLWLENNPCFSGSGNASVRVKFFKKIHRGDLLLTVLNGMPVMPPDLVRLGQGKRRSSFSSASTDD